MKKTLLSMLALATFGMASAVTAVTPAAGTANPFAYGLTGEFTAANNAASLKVNYALNTAADAVTLQVLKDGVVVAEEEGLEVTKGAHTATIDLTSLLSGAEYYGNYTWQIAVKGEAKQAPESFAELRFYHSRGVDVDNNFESPNFGDLYVTEGILTTSATYYSGANGGTGLYIFNPDMTGVKNEVTGKYAFMGGLTYDKNVTGTSVTSGADLARVRVAEDGRIFVTRLNDSGDYILYATDQKELTQTDKYTSLLSGGVLDDTDFTYKVDGSFLVGPNVAFDVKGNGKDLNLLALSGPKGLWNLGYKARLDEYSLGNASILPAPTAINSLSNKYTIAPQTTSVDFDNRGGVWYCQYRDQPSDVQPSLVYIDANGNEQLKEIDVVRGGGGVRVSPDGSQIAISTSQRYGTQEKSFVIYDLSFNEEGKPTITETHRVIHKLGHYVNDIAWDCAGNVYMVGHNAEYLQGIAIPRANNTFATKAASKYAFVIDAATAIDAIEAENTPVEYYNLQGVKVENPSNGIFIKKQGAKATKVVL